MMDVPVRKTANQDAINNAFDPFLPPMPADKADWTYRDVRWLLVELWEQFTAILGEGNYQLLARSTRKFKDDDRLYVGGQFLISPTGMANLKAYSEQKTSM